MATVIPPLPGVIPQADFHPFIPAQEQNFSTLFFDTVSGVKNLHIVTGIIHNNPEGFTLQQAAVFPRNRTVFSFGKGFQDKGAELRQVEGEAGSNQIIAANSPEIRIV